MAALQPTKRKRQEMEYSSCIICQTVSKEPVTKRPQMKSYENILTSCQQRVEYGDTLYSDLNERLDDLSAEDLAANSAVYHRNCYQKLTNIAHLERAKERFEKSSGRCHIASRKTREQEPMPSTSEERVHRSSISPLNKDLCIFCQEISKEKLHEIVSSNMGSRVITAVENSTDITLKVRIGSILTHPKDAFAHDMKYHLGCLRRVERLNDQLHKKSMAREDRGRLGHEIADIEIINVVQSALNDPSSIVLDMNIINTTYLNILEENEIETKTEDNYKRHVKTLLKEHIADIEFVKAKRPNEPDKICSKSTLGVCIDIAEKAKDDTSDLKILMKSASIIRKEIAASAAWTFQGSFADYAVPQRLYTFIKWIIEGPHSTVQTDRKQAVLQKSASNISQHIVSAFKSDRQIKYVSPIADDKFKLSSETAFSLGVSLLLHQQTRKKSLVDIASRLGIGERYSRVLRLEAQLAHAVTKRLNECNGLYIPPFVVKNKSVFFAIDNVDFLEDTPTGKDTLHGTAIVMYQKETETENRMVSSLEVEGIGKKQSLTEPIPFELLPCQAPKLKFEPIRQYTVQRRHGISEVYRIWDLAWAIASCIRGDNPDVGATIAVQDVAPVSEPETGSDASSCVNIETEDLEPVAETPEGGFSECIPTWNAYNSLITTTGTKTNVAVVPPLIRHSPTSWPGLYTALKRAQNISALVVGEGKPTVITLDLQLYEKAQKLMSKEDMTGKFVLRIGELHTVFSALKAIGRYIECSGIDQLWVEAGMYSPTTVRQIIEGKHLYRAMEAHMVTLITLYSLLIPALWDSGFDGKPEIEKAASDVNVSAKNIQEPFQIKEAHVKMVAAIEQVGLLTNLNHIDEHLRGMHSFLRNYMKQFECILRHIRASRQGEWRLHLAAQEELCKYFFAHDHLNYARLSPLYCAEMRKLETSDHDTWKALEDGDFCVTKSSIPFCSIGPDHGIEQENRTMKVIGGITGITQKEATLDKFFLIAPELARLVNEFGDLNGVSIKQERTKHHDLVGAARSRIFRNAEKMQNIILSQGNPFTVHQDEVVNLMTKAVMKDEVKDSIMNRDQIGQEAFEQFVNERINTDTKFFWDPMKKLSLKLFRNSSKLVKTKIGEKVTELREERNLLARFLIIMRSRPEIDMKEAIGQYEFSAVPRSLFSADGEMLLAYDKASILHALEDLPKRKQNQREGQEAEVAAPTPPDTGMEVNDGEEGYKVLILDGMALVNSIQKKDESSMKTCQDFAEAFIRRLDREASSYSEVRLIFDRYLTSSLKEKTREKRTAGNEIKYRVSDNTNIANVPLKQFLSHIDTKAELTTYLSEKALSRFQNKPNTRFVVVHDTVAESNFEDFSEDLKKHDHEEADTLIVLHALDASNSNRQVDSLHVFSPDTDVFLLLLNKYPQLCQRTVFITGRGQTRRQIPLKNIHEQLGKEKAEGLLGFHAFTGADTSGRFAGKTKKKCFQTFMTASSDELRAFGNLGRGVDLPSTETVTALEKFVCRLYCPKGSDIVNIPQCRWYLFSQKHAEGEKLPPTLVTLFQHVSRAHFITMIWVKADEPCQELPPPTNYGWVLENDRLVPVRSSGLPAPLSVLVLIKCSCKASSCASSKCSCMHANMKCTELCGCSDDCQNASDTVSLSEIEGIQEADSDDSDDED